MEISVTRQLICTAAAFCYGILSASIFGVCDVIVQAMCFRISEKQVRSLTVLYRVLQSLFDLICCLTVTVGFQVLLYAVDYGRFRLIYLFSLILGFVLYTKTIGKLINSLLSRLISILARVVLFALFYVTLPIKFALSLIGKVLHKIICTLVVEPFRKIIRRKNILKLRKTLKRDLSCLIEFECER